MLSATCATCDFEVANYGMNRRDEFCDYLLEQKGFRSDIVTSFNRNQISGATFLDLNDEDLKDLVPVVGDRVDVCKLLVESREVVFHLYLYVKSVSLIIYYC